MSEFLVVWWPIDRPISYARNSRKIPQRAIDKVAASIQEFGFRQCIVVDKDGVIVVGHTRWLAAKKLGLREVPVHVAENLTPAQVKAYRLMDNRSHQETDWDLELLGPELEDLKSLDFDLSLTGFNQREIEALLLAPNAVEDDAPPLPDNAVSKPGDLWLMGTHRLLCGDSTNTEDVARLMSREKARLFACDPPYLINYKGGNHPQSWANSPDTKDKHWDDYQDPAKAVEFYVDYLRIGLAHCIDRVPVYQWHGDLRRVIVAEAWERAGLLLHQIIVWVKARPVLTRSHFMWQHEVCAYGWPTGKVPSKPPANSHSVWTIDQIGESDGIHPTQKPVELARRPILYQTQPGDICYEPFSGSGTTIAAAELTGRRCYAMEISPAFVDVAVTRWQSLTNQTARLDGDGRTFEEIKADRLRIAA
jgi:DNA modification methylase